MLKRRILFLVIFLFFVINLSYGLDWQELHEKADNMNLPDALASVRARHDSIEDLYVLGLVYLNLHKDKEALETFNTVLSLDPKVIEAKWGGAEALRRQRRINESERILNGVIESVPSFSPAYISLAYIKYMQTDFEKTVWLALRVIKQGRQSVDLSNYTRAYLLVGGAKGMIASRGGALSKIINGMAVLPNLLKAEKLQPNSSAVLFGLGSFYFLAPKIAGGDIDKATGYFERAIEIDPLFADAYVRLAQIYRVKGDSEKSERYSRQAREIDPENELLQDFEKGKCKFNCVTVKE